MSKKRVAIIGSHGLYANYGGWDQLVKNLAEKKSPEVEYLIFNSSDTRRDIVVPSGVKVKWLPFKASGFQGLFFDFWSILICFLKVDTLLLLGVQGITIIPFLRLIKRNNIVSNVGGIEWERPKFGFFSKQYLKLCFNLSFRYSNYVILDNEYYKVYSPKTYKATQKVIPYGGEIDMSLSPDVSISKKYPFLKEDYFLSISRSLEDNMIVELCECFTKTEKKLVLISNFSKSEYGNKVLDKYSSVQNLILINGLYNKQELDLVRRSCKAYIHTHTLCGTAPSLVEMIISNRPIISVDRPQNKFTLKNQGLYYSNFNDLNKLINSKDDYSEFVPKGLSGDYSWDKIVKDYEELY